MDDDFFDEIESQEEKSRKKRRKAYEASREYDPPKEEEGGITQEFLDELTNPSINKVREIFAWADNNGIQLEKAATWHDIPTQFDTHKDKVREVRKLINRLRSAKAGIELNKRLEKILEDTQEVDTGIVRPYRDTRNEELNIFHEDLKQAYIASRLRGAELSNLKYEILDKYPRAEKVEFTQSPPEPEPRQHRRRSRTPSRSGSMEISTSEFYEAKAKHDATQKNILQKAKHDQEVGIHVPKPNNSEKLRHLDRLSQSTISTPARTDSEVVKRSVDKSRRPVVHGYEQIKSSDSLKTLPSSASAAQDLKNQQIIKFTSGGSPIEPPRTLHPNKEVAQKKEKPFESAIFSGGITPKPISQKPPAKGFNKVDTADATKLSSTSSSKVSYKARLRPELKDIRGDSQAQFKSDSDKASMASVESTGRLRGTSLMDVDSGSMVSDSASIASVDGKIVRKKSVINTKPPAKKFQPMLSEGSASYEVAAKPEPKNRFESSTAEVYSEPPQPRPATRLANSNVQSTEVSKKTPISRRVRDGEETLPGRVNLGQLQRQVYGLSRIVHQQFGGGAVGRPSANPLNGILRRRNSNDLW